MTAGIVFSDSTADRQSSIDNSKSNLVVTATALGGF
jgi:hypothetical protein